MTANEYDSMPAIERLRRMVSGFNCCSESFLQSFSMDELVTLHRSWMISDWDIYPDRWTDRQVTEALAGIPPNWDDKMRPVYATECLEVRWLKQNHTGTYYKSDCGRWELHRQHTGKGYGLFDSRNIDGPPVSYPSSLKAASKSVRMLLTVERDRQDEPRPEGPLPQLVSVTLGPRRG